MKLSAESIVLLVSWSFDVNLQAGDDSGPASLKETLNSKYLGGLSEDDEKPLGKVCDFEGSTC
jgi:hypothetical protein